MLSIAGAMLTAAVPAHAQLRMFQMGRTSVALSSDFLGAVTALNVNVSMVGEGRLRDGAVSFPITEGAIALNNAKGEIQHAGGITLAAGNTRVHLLNYTIDTAGGTPVLTGLVIANEEVLGRVPLFNLILPNDFRTPVRAPFGRFLELNNIRVTLTSQAAGALNGAFGISAFTPGFLIGTASVAGIFERMPGDDPVFDFLSEMVNQ